MIPAAIIGLIVSVTVLLSMLNRAAISVREIGWQARSRRSKRLDFLANDWLLTPLFPGLFFIATDSAIECENHNSTMIQFVTPKIETRSALIFWLLLRQRPVRQLT
jgi:hypothetical protein